MENGGLSVEKVEVHFSSAYSEEKGEQNAEDIDNKE